MVARVAPPVPNGRSILPGCPGLPDAAAQLPPTDWLAVILDLLTVHAADGARAVPAAGSRRG